MKEKSDIFKPNSEDDAENCVSSTSGIDLFITEDRVIIVELLFYIFI